jgi:UDP-N-acetylglucosamine acyltransferase
MTQVHRSAIVDPHAQLGQNVIVGPYCLIESGTVIGDDCQLGAGAAVHSGTTIGRNNRIGENAIIGGSAREDEAVKPSGIVTIGDNNQIRENVTIHRASSRGAATVIKDDNLLMVSARVAHDCQVGSRCVIVNHVLLGPFVQVGDGAYLGGASAVAEHCRIGRLAMIGALTMIAKDVPPFIMVAESQVIGLNRVGLKRNGFTAADVVQLKAAYRVIYRNGLRWSDVLATLAAEFADGPAADLRDFLAAGQRGFVQERLPPRTATLPFVQPSA